jgi:hypothetical protein
MFVEVKKYGGGKTEVGNSWITRSRNQVEALVGLDRNKIFSSKQNVPRMKKLQAG